ncbi:hypothetical protein GCM10025868_15650 [Angustibacter aerolatus]|uniref:Secreted protein n=1 Tax=Angustibacter aerolatus TaxID=1162965 RepID=A0ABQ6JGI7_9ACTN|nr:hypothetical protein GCM10025868_15650 [Angustibacter aerolatus]
MVTTAFAAPLVLRGAAACCAAVCVGVPEPWLRCTSSVTPSTTTTTAATAPTTMPSRRRRSARAAAARAAATFSARSSRALRPDVMRGSSWCVVGDSQVSSERRLVGQTARNADASSRAASRARLGQVVRLAGGDGTATAEAAAVDADAAGPHRRDADDEREHQQAGDPGRVPGGQPQHQQDGDDEPSTGSAWPTAGTTASGSSR